MSLKVCLGAASFDYPEGGGHLWVYLNWSLGLRRLGCEVMWLEAVDSKVSVDKAAALLAGLKSRLEPYGLAEQVALCSATDEPLHPSLASVCLCLEEACQADLLLNLAYSTDGIRPECFRRSAMVDIDPGILQIWMTQGLAPIPRHDVYFTIGETVGRPGARFPTAGLKWEYTPPCVALDWWPVQTSSPDAPFTTVSHWTSGDWFDYGGQLYRNDKRSGFLPFLDLPQRTTQALELAICLRADEQLRPTPDQEEERLSLEHRGWRVRHAHSVAATPWDYQRYIADSRGECSCAKPSCAGLQNAWISDRTLCYLASGKPAVIQHTGPSRFLPDAAGIFRFRDVEEAARFLETVAADYDRQCRLARSVAEEFFSATKVLPKVLERALG
jgi:hypothetical protein